MKSFKGNDYFKDSDGLWKVKLSEGNYYIVALDDSKLSGKRVFNRSNNCETACNKYILFITKKRSK